MKGVKLAAILVVVYVGVVVAFESMIGFFQPESESTIVITTVDDQGRAEDRVLQPVVNQGQLYVSANHWPRSWYNRARRNPEVEVLMDGETQSYTAVPVPITGEVHARLMTEHAHPLFFRILTGFPPRYFLHLEPR